ncbi:uncharacterized protein LOC124142877 [Haliotis rufescens]|uniref:uncharacterized protein LOC124142877 n=1 Tax=Haliotis rufescens TaxID=6454 RepID=UPI00201F33FC|nr:uncharacterized protein LOC124142877 [Haliotis rufescens]
MKVQKNCCLFGQRCWSVFLWLSCCCQEDHQVLKETQKMDIMEDIPVRAEKRLREDWASHLTAEQRMAPVTERVVLLVSECLGGGWEAVGLRLGLSYACVQRCKLPRCMLDKWRMKEGGKATVDVLVNVLQESVYTCTVDMFAVVQCLQQTT